MNTNAMKLTTAEFELLHEALLELMWNHKLDNAKCKAANKMIDKIRFESKNAVDKPNSVEEKEAER